MSRKSSTTTARPHEAPSFSEFITDLDHGRIDQEATERLAELTRAVQETKKVGELTLKLSLKFESGRAIVVPEIKIKKPQHGLLGTLFYVGENGELLRDDPKQEVMKEILTPPMRAVAFPTAGPPIERTPLERPRQERAPTVERVHNHPPVDAGNEQPDSDDEEGF
jgi:hypothetical protein